MRLPMQRDLLERRPRAAAGQDRFGPAHALERALARLGQALGDEVPRQAHGDARPAGEQRAAGAGRRDGDEVRFADGVDDDEDFAARRGFVERRRDLGRPRRDAGMRDEPDGPPALPGEPAADVGIGHRVERMRAQARLAEQPVADEQMPLIDRAAGGRKGRACRNPGDAEGLGERLADRTDIAGRRRIEGRAVFEDELAAALRAQPIEGGERLGDGLGRGDRAALQRHHAGIATRRRRRPSGRRGIASS